MIIVDTGFWVALANKNDNYHESAKKCFSKYNEPLITTWCVVTETWYFLQSRRGVEASITFLNAMSEGLFQVFEIRNDHIPRIQELRILVFINGITIIILRIFLFPEVVINVPNPKITLITINSPQISTPYPPVLAGTPYYGLSS